MPENTENNQHPFAGVPVITGYGRAQAIEDGVLIDATGTAEEAGFKYPVAVTDGVMTQVVLPSEKALAAGETANARLWDVLWMLLCAIRLEKNKDAETVTFDVLATDQFGVKQRHELWSQCGPGDEGEPVITIMLIGED